LSHFSSLHLRFRPWLALISLQLLAPAESAAEEPRSQEQLESSGPDRIFADAFLVWIYKSPKRDPAPIGYLRGGQSALLRSDEGRPSHLPV